MGIPTMFIFALITMMLLTGCMAVMAQEIPGWQQDAGDPEILLPRLIPTPTPLLDTATVMEKEDGFWQKWLGVHRMEAPVATSSHIFFPTLPPQAGAFPLSMTWNVPPLSPLSMTWQAPPQSPPSPFQGLLPPLRRPSPSVKRTTVGAPLFDVSQDEAMARPAPTIGLFGSHEDVVDRLEVQVKLLKQQLSKLEAAQATRHAMMTMAVSGTPSSASPLFKARHDGDEKVVHQAAIGRDHRSEVLFDDAENVATVEPVIRKHVIVRAIDITQPTERVRREAQNEERTRETRLASRSTLVASSTDNSRTLTRRIQLDQPSPSAPVSNQTRIVSPTFALRQAKTNATISSPSSSLISSQPAVLDRGFNFFKRMFAVHPTTTFTLAPESKPMTARSNVTASGSLAMTLMGVQPTRLASVALNGTQSGVSVPKTTPMPISSTKTSRRGHFAIVFNAFKSNTATVPSPSTPPTATQPLSPHLATLVRSGAAVIRMTTSVTISFAAWSAAPVSSKSVSRRPASFSLRAPLKQTNYRHGHLPTQPQTTVLSQSRS